MHETITSLASLLRPYRQKAIQEATGAGRQTVFDWAHGNRSPNPRHLSALAELLRIDLGELTRIVAQDSTRKSASRVSRQDQVA